MFIVDIKKGTDENVEINGIDSHWGEEREEDKKENVTHNGEQNEETIFPQEKRKRKILYLNKN